MTWIDDIKGMLVIFSKLLFRGFWTYPGLVVITINKQLPVLCGFSYIFYCQGLGAHMSRLEYILATTLPHIFR